MKKSTAFKTLALLLLLTATLLTVLVSCKKKNDDNPSPEDGEQGRKISVWSNIWFADESAYVKGVLNDSTQPTSMDMKLGKIYYVVVDTTIHPLRSGENLGETVINIDVTPSRVVDATVEVSTAGSLSESFILDSKCLTLTAKLPDMSVPQKNYRVVIAITPIELGEATVEVNITAKDTEIEGYPETKKTFNVNGSEITPSPLEYTLSPDKTHYIVTGLGSTQGGIINVPATYSGLPVKEIGERAFFGYSALKKLTLAEGIERIKASAFEGCGKFFDITLPSTITEVNPSAFNGVKLRSASASLSMIQFLPKENLRVLYIRGGGNITAETLKGFDALRTLNALDEGLSAEENALSGLYLLIANVHSDFIKHLPTDSLMYVNINAGTQIEAEAFKDFDSLLQITVYNGIQTVGADAFKGCEKLRIIYNNSSVSMNDSVGATVNPLSLSLSRIGEFIYENKSGIIAYVGESENVIIPENGYQIENYAFKNNKRIKSVFIPKDVTSLGNNVFDGCDALETVTFDAESVISDINYAFQGCTGLKSLEIPKNVTSINGGMLNGTLNLETLTVNPGNSVYSAEGNCVIEKATGTIVLGCKGSVIPTSTSVHSIASLAFFRVSGLKQIYIPANIQRISSDSFYWCTNVEKIDVDAGNPIYEAINNCIIEKSGKILKYGCKTSVIDANYGITEIDYYAFAGSNITNVVIPEGVKKIDERAFFSCSLLESITLPSSLTYIGQYSFAALPKLTEIRVPKSVAFIGQNAFERCNALSLYVQNGANKNAYQQYWNRRGSGYNAQDEFTIFYHTVKSYN